MRGKPMSQSINLKLLSETLPLTISDQGTGQAYLVLHGGAGPTSVGGLAEALAKNGRAIVPTLPGYAGQPRPDWFHRVEDLVYANLALLERLDLEDVVVIGNSLGGWIAAEMALRFSPRILSMVLVNACGIDAGAGNPAIVNPLSVPPEERAALSFHDPKRFATAPRTPEALAAMAANQRASMTYAGEPFMYDPGLRERLAQIRIPTLLLWGANDRIVTPAYGQRFANSIPNARFELVTEAGHFPQIERLDAVLEFVTRAAIPPAAARAHAHGGL
jgi:pimeloyl-ACP methyl ester carboxylesterase